MMQHGANARVGIYPHRDATSPLTIASERGYDEIVTIIREEERTRQLKKSDVASAADALFEAIRSGNDERAIALMDSDAALIRARHAVFDCTPLLLAAQVLNVRLLAWLLDHGADPNRRGLVPPFDDLDQRAGGDIGQTPLDAAAYRVGVWGEDNDNRDRFGAVANLLMRRGIDAARGGGAWEVGVASRKTRRGHADEPYR